MNLSLGQDVLYKCTETIHQLGSFEAVFFSICISITAMVIHELGHYFAAKSLGYDAMIQLKGTKLTTEVIFDGEIDKDKHKGIAIWGIISGGLVIIAAANIHIFYLLMAAPYITGCHNDIKELMKK